MGACKARNRDKFNVSSNKNYEIVYSKSWFYKQYLVTAWYTQTPIKSMFPQNVYEIYPDIGVENDLIGACYTQLPIESMFPQNVHRIHFKNWC